MKISDIVKLMDKNGHIKGSLDLRGCDLNGITLPTSMGGSLDLRGCDLNGITLPTSVGGYLYLRGCDLNGITLPTSVGCYLYLSGTQWAQVDFAILQKFAAPWFAETLVVDNINIATGWCKDGIREAIGDLGLKCDNDTESYDRAEVHAALRRASAAIGDNERASIALAILDRVEDGR
jgi:hypothetical protein